MIHHNAHIFFFALVEWKTGDVYSECRDVVTELRDVTGNSKALFLARVRDIIVSSIPTLVRDS